MMFYQNKPYLKPHFLVLFLVYLMGISFHSHANDTLATTENIVLKEFSATYDLRWHGIRLGTSQNILKKIGNRSYTVESISKPIVGFLPLEEQEYAKFKFNQGQITPIENRYQSVKKGISKVGKLRFDWSKHIVALERVNKKPSLRSLNNHAYDKITHFLQLQLDLKANKRPLHYRVIEPDQERMYSYKIQGHEILKTKCGVYDTVIVEHISSDRKRLTKLWLAPELDYMIVKLQQVKDGKNCVEVVLKQVEIAKF